MPRKHRRKSDRFPPGPDRCHGGGIPDPTPCPAHQGQDKLVRCLACERIFCGACHPGPCPVCEIAPVWEDAKEPVKALS